MKHPRLLQDERNSIRDDLLEIAAGLNHAATECHDTPQGLRAQTFGIKLATRRLNTLHVAILCGKGRQK
jgi:hypothetical protein